MYLIISLIGLIFTQDYMAIINQPGWFVTYSILIGWWIALFPTREYYMKNEEYLKRVFH